MTPDVVEIIPAGKATVRMDWPKRGNPDRHRFNADCRSVAHYTIDAQQTDRAYKEIAIQPRLWLGGDPDNFGLTLKNTGLGPAIIDTIVIQVGGQCESTSDNEPDEWAKLFVSFVNEMVTPLYTSTLPRLPMSRGSEPKFNVQSNVLRVGDSIRPGEKYSIINLDPDTMDALSQVDSTELIQAQQKFSEAAYGVPIRIGACSATGRTCGIIGKAIGCNLTLTNGLTF